MEWDCEKTKNDINLNFSLLERGKANLNFEISYFKFASRLQELWKKLVKILFRKNAIFWKKVERLDPAFFILSVEDSSLKSDEKIAWWWILKSFEKWWCQQKSAIFGFLQFLLTSSIFFEKIRYWWDVSFIMNFITSQITKSQFLLTPSFFTWGFALFPKKIHNLSTSRAERVNYWIFGAIFN